MKKILISILVGLSLSICSCNDSSSNVDPKWYEEQEIYNRILTDYYEQRVLKDGIVGSDGVLYSNLNIKKEELQINYIGYLDPINQLCIFGIDDELWNNKYSGPFFTTYLTKYAFLSQNTIVNICGSRPVEVWYRGQIYFLHEAIYNHVVNLNTLLIKRGKRFFKSPSNISDRLENPIKYNSDIKDFDDIIENHNNILCNFQNDFCNQILKNNYPNKNASDIHLFWNFGNINNKSIVIPSLNGVGCLSEISSSILKIGEEYFDVSMKFDAYFGFKKQYCMPYVYVLNNDFVSGNFYTLIEAFDIGILSIEEIKKTFSSYDDSNLENYYV